MKTMRLIDADVLRELFDYNVKDYCAEWEALDKPSDLQFLIDEQPTVEIPSSDYPCMTCIHHCKNNLNYQPKVVKVKGGVIDEV